MKNIIDKILIIFICNTFAVTLYTGCPYTWTLFGKTVVNDSYYTGK
ncbi:MAG: hypothetical protein WC389_19060 [Lutibacter sp.]|jgi:hypothetical protein